MELYKATTRNKTLCIGGYRSLFFAVKHINPPPPKRYQINSLDSSQDGILGSMGVTSQLCFHVG
jgi:hypothetical protein